MIIKVKYLNDTVQSINNTHNTTLTQNNSIIKVEHDVDKCKFNFFLILCLIPVNESNETLVTGYLTIG